jgi:hypothetical protein
MLGRSSSLAAALGSTAVAAFIASAVAAQSHVIAPKYLLNRTVIRDVGKPQRPASAQQPPAPGSERPNLSPWQKWYSVRNHIAKP